MVNAYPKAEDFSMRENIYRELWVTLRKNCYSSLQKMMYHYISFASTDPSVSLHDKHEYGFRGIFMAGEEVEENG